MAEGFAPLELRDRAVRFVGERGAATQDEVLTHVYGGPAPAALSARLAAPLLADPRLSLGADGRWTLRPTPAQHAAALRFTSLAIVATGPTPGRARVVRISALHVEAGEVAERFDVILHPGSRVPRYVAERVGLDPEALNGQPEFGDIADDLVHFVADRPILAQDVQLTWAFLDAEMRRLGRILVAPGLLDLNELASRLLKLNQKPSLSRVASQLGISSVRVTQPDEEARVLASVGSLLMALGSVAEAGTGSRTLRRGATARSLPDEPGVYVLRDDQQNPLYVGKARRLRARMAAYVHRPLGATRRLEGLVAAVHVVDSTQCATDLEALVLEEREIGRLRPRFNTVREQRTPRYWIRLPPPSMSSKRRVAPPRLELSFGPPDEEGEFVGPFRNEFLAEQARALAREVFELDALRRSRSDLYTARLAEAWRFLQGASEVAEPLARGRSLALLRQVLAFDVAPLLLPADPRHARYAVVRPGAGGVEGFVVDRAIFVGWASLPFLEAEAVFSFARRLLAPAEPRTTATDTDVVLRWFGAQRPPARLILLPDDDPLAAADAIEAAALALLAGEA